MEVFSIERAGQINQFPTLIILLWDDFGCTLWCKIFPQAVQVRVRSAFEETTTFQGNCCNILIEVRRARRTVHVIS
jgi:hypothetical protein